MDILKDREWYITIPGFSGGTGENYANLIAQAFQKDII